MTNNRKRVKHFHERGDLHELTFSCHDQRPLLTNEHWLKLLAKAVDSALVNHQFHLYAFVFMPEHVHLLVYPSGEPDIGGFLKAIKRPISFRIKQGLATSNRRLLDELTVQERPGVTSFRFWQEGPGYDRNLQQPDAIKNSLDYIHMNPVKRELARRPEDWKWSSARYFRSDGAELDSDLPTLTKLPANVWD